MRLREALIRSLVDLGESMVDPLVPAHNRDPRQIIGYLCSSTAAGVTETGMQILIYFPSITERLNPPNATRYARLYLDDSMKRDIY